MYIEITIPITIKPLVATYLNKEYTMNLAKEVEIVKESLVDKTNFLPIYREYVKDIYRYAYSLTNSANEAEEVTSITFL